MLPPFFCCQQSGIQRLQCIYILTLEKRSTSTARQVLEGQHQDISIWKIISRSLGSRSLTCRKSFSVLQFVFEFITGKRAIVLNVSAGSIMRKYQQLLIVALGMVSFICFLIYKHEYDRLRNVIEVLEVFGSPPSAKPNESMQLSKPNNLENNVESSILKDVKL